MTSQPTSFAFPPADFVSIDPQTAQGIIVVAREKITLSFPQSLQLTFKKCPAMNLHLNYLLIRISSPFDREHNVLYLSQCIDKECLRAW
jgi:hypothetical protein